MERLFDLDFQLLHDAILTAVSVFFLFLFLSYLLFNPVRDMLNKRREKIQDDIDSAKKDKEAADAMRAEYEDKLRNADAEADTILADARKRATANENHIIAEAKEEAARIIKQAHVEAELEKEKAKDEIKNEMIQIASLMAGKVVGNRMDTTVQDALVEETLKEVGDDTWRS
ncbi:MAG: F0F1 ATP synthase subunit B [Lachnospiraceae bacterium]|nr:F0F1 ATP synthase subunit B [Lachnospiraceae bacterium]MBR5766514.1 F0F1 ATP synthase subunit B [Lachnospiraceae bacterium]MBR6469477.1 F0F1 ATP synthase subunit B [Lachnospiraceae bacterium]MBR6485357.1 F0F1 ATP synthase subunit B [Lachnospiraceae bacterium]